MSSCNFDEYLISDDKSLLSLDDIMGMLTKSYWANQRPRELNEEAIKNSVCFGVYLNDKQVGYARVVTDYATMFWLCDVIIDEAHRGKGIGKKLIEFITESETLKGKLGILFTKDAHGLYEQYGFKRNPDSCMSLPPIRA